MISRSKSKIKIKSFLFWKDFKISRNIWKIYSKYSRQDLITRMKDVKQKIKWDKDTAKLFGAALKKTKESSRQVKKYIKKIIYLKTHIVFFKLEN